ncbi:Clathrin light chain 1 [Heracleum sosnowskyi]|uniref:Clathrin light chain 1 n=1 Tax=Heracleum sosnowskyi TaxID=360622 RepID=A0AAD8J3P6_9APIA|nr:Clathrin light chain 1 [Heracleum sosnowskyi]
MEVVNHHHLPFPSLLGFNQSPLVPKFVSVFRKTQVFKTTLKSKFLITSTSSSRVSSFLKCCCTSNQNDNTSKPSQGFSVLESDIECDIGSLWSTMGLYMFSFHIPLSFGGLSIVSQLLHTSSLDHQTQAISVLLLQILELVVVSLLLRFSAKPPYKIFSNVEADTMTNERNWLLASVFGFGFLVLLVFITSLIADSLIGPKDVNNPVLKEILLSGSISLTACSLVYCIITPFLEETVYRGFLLKYLASTMEWPQALLISSAIFSAAHLSGENFLQLFIIGLVLGCSYCWTGKLSSSIAIHSMYNALTLLITLTS